MKARIDKDKDNLWLIVEHAQEGDSILRRSFINRDSTDNLSVAYPVLEEEIEPIYECLKEYLKK